MDRWRTYALTLRGRLLWLGAVGLAVLLLMVDLALDVRLAAVSGVVIAIMALARSDLARRVILAIAVSAVTDAAALLWGDGPTSGVRSFGLVETAGLGLLLVLATRQLPPWPARWLVPALSVAVLVLPQRLGNDQAGLTFVLGVCVMMAIALGLLLRAQDHERASALNRVRSDERLSLARDLHDSVAHHVTGIVVRAQAAQVVAADRPDEAVAALAAIEREGAATLASMRRLVGVLRDDDAERHPPAGLLQVRELVARFGAGGPTTTLSASPTAAGATLPDEVGAALHRVVQEALTNVRRHAARAARVDVEVDVVDDVLHVRVRDDGHDRATGGRDRGFGLVGLAERVRALGGWLTAGPLGAGGWEVVAAMPLATPRTGRDARPAVPPVGSGPQVTR